MKKIYAELEAKGSYIRASYTEEQFQETLKISKDNLLIALDYKDVDIPKRTNLKLLVFQNEYVFNRYQKWISKYLINGIKTTKSFHFYRQHHSISNTYIGLLTPKTEYNYFMGENQSLITEKLDKIAKLLGSDLENDIKIEEVWKTI